MYPYKEYRYTEHGFKKVYDNDLIELYKIVNLEISKKGYKVSDKNKLFKNLFEYIYTHSDLKKLNVE